MTILIHLFISAALSSGATLPDWDMGRHACLFDAEVLQAGASVSAGHGGDSPGTILHQAAVKSGNRGAKLNNIAIGVATSGTQVEYMLESFKDPNNRIKSVIGVDLFFWDADRDRCPGLSRQIRALLKAASAAGVNLILGNVPQTNECGNAINEQLRTCRPSDHCYLIDLKTMRRKMESQMSYTIDGITVPIRELMADRMHTSTVANKIIAETALRLMDGSKPLCPVPAVIPAITPKTEAADETKSGT